MGAVDPVTVVTNGNGVATITLSAVNAGVATVRGTAVGGAFGEVEVTITTGYQIYLPVVTRD